MVSISGVVECLAGSVYWYVAASSLKPRSMLCCVLYKHNIYRNINYIAGVLLVCSADE